MQTFLPRTTAPLKKFLPAVWLVLAVFAPSARAWWNSDWTMRKKITVDTAATGAAISSPIGTSPVLIRLHDGDFQFAAAKDDGGDLRFVAADDRTPLTYHIEKFDPLLDEAFIWVRVPDLKPGTPTSFWLYYGNSGGKAVRADDPKGTYDADTVLVWHFAEHGQPAADSTGFGNNALKAGIPADGSMIGTGLRLDGHDVLTIPASPSLAWNTGGKLTWSAWIKPVALQPDAIIFSRAEDGRGLVIGVNNGVPFVEITDQSGSRRSPSAAPLALNSWQHLAVIADAFQIDLLVDGQPYATLKAHLPALGGPAYLGGAAAGTADVSAESVGFTGEMDELEISKTARSPGFIQFAALSQGGSEAASKLLTLGEDEQPKNWFSWIKTGYIGIIIGSLSADGWVVIGILMVMSAISWLVMIAKATYLNRISKGNSLFLKEWKHVATDLSVLDDGDLDKAKTLGGRVDPATQRVMRTSPLYHIYHIGAEEIRHRVGQGRNSGAKILSARSIQAIRASLDGGLVRETQKLNRMMVLLTIAISGGPFLGLLGTVVGVMITFAAVAAAGDVNVNAIAPGIAAALAATVAGLAVAIPALFGYNYLLTRIKSDASDMHVFIDEFVAKMAEFYSESADQERTTTRSPFAPSEP